MPPGRPGRPRKSDDQGTPEQVAKRNYQRKYQSEVRQGIVDLEQAERNCLDELDRIRKERNRLIGMLGSANDQASAILKEKTKK
jgi:seryl-tRNA synthetase